MITLLGRPGSGKTDLLRRLDHFTSASPNAFWNFAPAPARPHQVAGGLAYRLSRRLRGRRPLHFPLLTGGLVAVQPDLRMGGRDRRRDRSALNEAMRRARKADAAEAAEMMAEVVGVINDMNVIRFPGAGQLASLLLRDIAPRLLSALSHTGLDWYARGTTQDPLDRLVELNQLSRVEDPSAAVEVDRKLCEAFLADLRAAYARRSGPGREHNCAVMLDNIDRHGGAAFVSLLLEVREAARRSGEGRDPLLVVASCSTARAVPGPFDPGPAGLRIRTVRQAGHDDWSSVAPSPVTGDAWWYAVRLPDLTLGEVVLLSENGGYRVGRATELVHRLTYGHPQSVRTLLERAKGVTGRPDAGQRPRDILNDDPPAHSGTASPGRALEPSTGRELLDYLLKGVPAERLAGLVTCAAARDMEIASDDLAGISGLVRIAPSNSDEAAAAATYLTRHYPKARVLLVRDTRSDDLYTSTLAHSFLASCPPSLMVGPAMPYDSSRAAVATYFVEQMANLCRRPAGGLLRRAWRGPAGVPRSAGGRALQGQEADRDLRRRRLAGPAVLRGRTGQARPVVRRHPAAPHRARAPRRLEAAPVRVRPGGPRAVPARGPLRRRVPQGPAGRRPGDHGLRRGAHRRRRDPAGVLQRHRAGSHVSGGAVRQMLTALNGKRAVSGASGLICLDSKGSPRDKAIPIVELNKLGNVSTVAVSSRDGDPPTKDSPGC